MVEGGRNMYYDYAHTQAEKVVELRHALFGESVNIVDGSTSSSRDIEFND